MTDQTFNSGLGRAVELANNVEINTPAGTVFRVHAWVITAAMDDVDNQDFVSELQALALSAEATNSGYTNQSIAAAAMVTTVNDTTNLVDIDLDDVTFTSVIAGDVWTQITVCYDPAGADVDTTNRLLTLHDFAVTPNGGDITVQWAAAGFFQAT